MQLSRARAPPASSAGQHFSNENRRRRMVYLVMDAEQVRSLREEQGVSQRQLAEVSGVARRTLANVEAGKAHTLPSTARKIGAALDVDPRSLATVASRA